MRYLFFLSFICWIGVAQANCPVSPSHVGSFEEGSAMLIYKACAEVFNDDEAQAKLAAIYDKGTENIKPNIKKALFYYQLSAENGNALSQGRLAELYIELDKSPQNRALFYDYLDSIFVNSLIQNKQDTPQGELLHPYVLLILANEKADNKWYYSTTVKTPSANAQALYRNYSIDEEQKKQFMKQATAWKQRKLLERARITLSPQEYQNFVDTLYPASGQADTFRRNQTLKEFKEKLQQQQDQKNAKAVH